MRSKTGGKRLLSMAVALCLTLSLGVTASAAKFTDLNRNHWAYDEIMDVVDKGLFKGTGESTFGPEVEMSRAMFVTVLARLSEADVDDGDRSDFKDVPRNTWYTGSVIWAADCGIVKGVSKDEFAPDRVITREEMATMIVRYTDYWDIDLPQTEKKIVFDDWRKVSDFADDAIEACQRAGLLNGVGNNLFDPKGTATRSQVAALISRVSELDGTVIYTVSFVTNTNAKVSDKKVPSGQKVDKPTGVRRSGYTLVNWYTDKNFKNVYDFKDPVEGDLTLYAKWRRNATGGGSSISYPNPEQPDAATLEAYLADQAAFKDIPLTYPKMTMDGDTIVLEGAFSAVDPVPGFPDYPKGYGVPLTLKAPSNYSSGEIKLEITGDKKGDVSKVVTLDGESFIYVLKYIPADTKDWDPTLSVTWNGYKVSYDFDVTGMKETVKPEDAKAKGPSAEEVGSLADTVYNGIDLTFADVAATKTADKDNTFQLYLSGGYAVGSKFPGFSESKYDNGYVVPLRFTAPAGHSVKADLKITGGVETIDKPNVDLSGGAFDLLMYIPASPSSSWDPVIQVTWTGASSGTLGSLFAGGDSVTYTYTLDLNGMRPIRSSDPLAPDAAVMGNATDLDAYKKYKGIENFTAKAEFSKPSWNSDKTLGTITVDVTYTPFLTGAVVPGIGTVGTTDKFGTDSFVLPIAFPVPDYLALDALKDTDEAVYYRFGSDNLTSWVDMTKAHVKNGVPVIIWLRVDAADVGNLKTKGLKFELEWFGGYQQQYLLKLGEVKSTQVTLTGKDMVSGTATIANIPQSSPFKGLDKVAANVTLTKETDGIFIASATYVPLTAGQNVPGFGKAGTADVPVDSCILPFAFPWPNGLDLNQISDSDTALTLVFKNGVSEKTYPITKAELKAEDPFHFYFIAKDPSSMGAVQLKFDLTWYGGLKQAFTVKFGELKAQTTNPEGLKYTLNADEKAAISGKDGPFKDIQIDPVDVIFTKVGDQNLLRLSTSALPQPENNIKQYYGNGYGEGYIVGLKFKAPDGASKLDQTILNGFTGATQTKQVELGADTFHTLLLYVPKNAPYGYAPKIQLTWKSTEGTPVKTETFQLDLTGMKITVAPAPVDPPQETAKTEQEKPQEDEQIPSLRDLFRNWDQ